MKRILLSVLAGAVVFGTVLGFAASLTVNSDKLGEGGTGVSSCGGPATVSYNNTYSATDGKYHVSSVDVGGLDTCGDRSKVSVALQSDSPITKIGDGQADVVTSPAGAKTTVVIDEAPLASAVTNVRVIVHNGNSSTAVATAAP